MPGKFGYCNNENVRSGGEANGGSLRMKRNGCRKLRGTEEEGKVRYWNRMNAKNCWEICPHLPFVPPLKFQHASTVCWYRFLHQGNKKIYRSFCTSPAPSPRRASGVAGSEENISPWPHKENPQKTQHKRVSWLDLGWLCDTFMLAAARRFRLNQT